MTFDEMSYKEELKVKITYYRKKSGLTQSEVAKKMGMTRSTYAYAETKATRLSPDFLNKLAGVFGISPALLLEKKEGTEDKVSGMQNPPPSPSFSVTQKEQRIIKMLRMMSDDSYDKIYNIIRNEYENTMDSDD